MAVHVTCSTQHLGEAQGLIDIVSRCTTQVVVPEGIHCCGFAGDKGFYQPELNAHALRSLKDAVQQCGEGISTSRTCEIGLSHHAGYRSPRPGLSGGPGHPDQGSQAVGLIRVSASRSCYGTFDPARCGVFFRLNIPSRRCTAADAASPSIGRAPAASPRPQFHRPRPRWYHARLFPPPLPPAHKAGGGPVDAHPRRPARRVEHRRSPCWKDCSTSRPTRPRCGTEILAGVTTFLTMAYVLFVNPRILAKTGMDQGAVFVATLPGRCARRRSSWACGPTT